MGKVAVTLLIEMWCWLNPELHLTAYQLQLRRLMSMYAADSPRVAVRHVCFYGGSVLLYCDAMQVGNRIRTFQRQHNILIFKGGRLDA